MNRQIFILILFLAALFFFLYRSRRNYGGDTRSYPYIGYDQDNQRNNRYFEVHNTLPGCIPRPGYSNLYSCQANRYLGYQSGGADVVPDPIPAPPAPPAVYTPVPIPAPPANNSPIPAVPAVPAVPGITPVITPRSYVPAICPSGYDNDGVNCVRPATSTPLVSVLAKCPESYTNDGTNCVSSSQTVASPSIVAICPTGYTNNGIACQSNADSYIKDCTIPGGPAYSCQSGFTDMGCYCENSAGVNTISLDNATCPLSYTRIGSRCYPICKQDFIRQGESCYKPADVKGNQYMTCPSGFFRKGSNCIQSCPAQTILTDTACVMPAQQKDTSYMTCPPQSPQLIGANCYAPCPIGSIVQGINCIKG